MKMEQSVKQKYSMKQVLAGTSILGCLLAALIITNLSNNETSLAAAQNNSQKVSYRSVEINLSEKMLLEANEINRMQQQCYKGKDTPQEFRLASRSTDVVIKKADNSQTE